MREKNIRKMIDDTVYIADDGKEFNSFYECRGYEANKKLENVEHIYFEKNSEFYREGSMFKHGFWHITKKEHIENLAVIYSVISEDKTFYGNDVNKIIGEWVTVITDCDGEGLFCTLNEVKHELEQTEKIILKAE